MMVAELDTTKIRLGIKDIAKSEYKLKNVLKLLSDMDKHFTYEQQIDGNTAYLTLYFPDYMFNKILLSHLNISKTVSDKLPYCVGSLILHEYVEFLFRDDYAPLHIVLGDQITVI